MNIAHLRREEKVGLAVAVAAHLALFAGLALHAMREPAHVPVPERMVVSLADEVSLTSTAPDPSPDAQAAIAPTLSERPEPVPEPQERIEPPRPTPVPTPDRPLAQPKPKPKPTAKPSPQPTAKASPKSTAKPSPQPTARASAKPKPKPTAKPSAKPAGGSRIGDDFLKGTSAGERSSARGTPAATFGPAQQASLVSAISRQLRPHWNAPQGVDVEKLVTLLDWDLNADGTLAGRPRLKSQSGITDANRPQAGRHAELAIRAVQLAAPFDLPAEYYDHWKRIRNWRFDRNSAQ